MTVQVGTCSVDPGNQDVGGRFYIDSEEVKLKTVTLLTVQSASALRDLICLRSKYISELYVLLHSWSVLPPLSERPGFTHMQDFP